MTLQSFVDADLGGDVESRKSTFGYIYTIGGTVVSWMSSLQKCVSLSSTEAEYVAIAEAGKEMIWLADYLDELTVLKFYAKANHRQTEFEQKLYVSVTLNDEDEATFGFGRIKAATLRLCYIEHEAAVGLRRIKSSNSSSMLH
uniref:Reverse transcriptase Ty1/copia-type domain-containing protein n=1 Tax=Solanum lycopersicum TaxID=4081 RepID=A0A3Q7HZN8_SOLLC